MASIVDVYLPQEVWENIFKYLTTSDVINLCKTNSRYMHFLREKNVVKCFDVSMSYDFYDADICSYIKENVSYEYIRTLNINRVYWVPVSSLRILLKNLVRLEELLALNTSLSLRPKDVVLYSNLRTLAITVEGSHFIHPIDPLLYKNNLYLLKRLCIHISIKHPKYLMGMCRLFNDLFALQELWICDSDDSVLNPIKYDALVAQLKFLKKLVIKSKVNIPFLDYKPFGLAKYFETRRFKSIVMRYEQLPADQIVSFKDVSIFRPCESELEEAWCVLQSYRSEMPYDSMAHKEVYMTKQINDVKFKELNFFHKKCFCTNDYIKATLDFLRSENSRDVEKLSIKTCILQRQPVAKGNTLMRLDRKYPILDVIENCPKIKTLELMQCLNCNVTIFDAYPFIANWRYLERLTLEVPVNLNGKFLIELIMNNQLKHLRIISYHTNENLNRSVYQALPFATKLEDFFFQNRHINLPALFNSLNQIGTGKLRRMHITCDDSEATKLDALKRFLGSNPQLVFLCLTINKKNRGYMTSVQEVMDAFQKKQRTKRYYAQKDDRLFTRNIPMPEAHRELSYFDTEVSTVDFYSFR